MGLKEIERFLDAAEMAMQGNDRSLSWPANGVQMGPYYDDFLAADLYSKIDVLRRMSRKKLFELFGSPNVIKAALVHYGIVGTIVNIKHGDIKGNTYVEKDNVWFTNALLSILKKMSAGDPFCLDGTNKVLTDKEVKKQLELIRLKQTDLEASKQVCSMITAGHAACWSLYFDIFSQLAMDSHGPYKIPEGYLIIRDFFDLNPEFWPEKLSRYKKLRIFTVYSEPDLKINFFSHVLTRHALVDKLTHFCVVADDKYVLDLKEIASLHNELSNLRQVQVAKVNMLPPQEIIYKAAEICYHSLKGVREYFGEDWRPPKELIYKRFNDWGLRWWLDYKNAASPAKGHYRKLFDPRTLYLDAEC